MPNGVPEGVRRLAALVDSGAVQNTRGEIYYNPSSQTAPVARKKEGDKPLDQCSQEEINDLVFRITGKKKSN